MLQVQHCCCACTESSQGEQRLLATHTTAACAPDGGRGASYAYSSQRRQPMNRVLSSVQVLAVLRL